MAIRASDVQAPITHRGTMKRCIGFISHPTLMTLLFRVVGLSGNRYRLATPSAFGRYVQAMPLMENFHLLRKSCICVGRQIKMRLYSAKLKTSTPATV